MSTDPDDKATADAAGVLERILKEAGVQASAKVLKWAAYSTICKWIERRGFHWATQRGKAGFGEPDVMVVGFAEASLGQIADKGAGLPFEIPIGEWTHADAARLFAIAHEAIQATIINTLEDPNEQKGFSL